jgi:hypothetical protein
MNRVAEFVYTAQLHNTRRSHACALSHFEFENKGLLPALDRKDPSCGAYGALA